jgi:hypothetical protein
MELRDSGQHQPRHRHRVNRIDLRLKLTLMMGLLERLVGLRRSEALLHATIRTRS